MVAVRYPTQFQLYPYRRSPDQDAPEPARHKVVVVGGGPIGMAMALDLGLKGVPVLLLDDHDGVGIGSRAICFSKRTLEIADRLGFGDAAVEKGVVWNEGRVFRDERQIYGFNLLPEDGHKRPAFINLQQPHFERFIFEAIERAQAKGAPIEIRGRNGVTAVAPEPDGVRLEVDTPEGPYRLEADWLIACDGARSPVRGMMGLGFEGRVFEDNFLIVDVKMEADFPTERWFWFDPPFNRDQSVLLHKQPDGVWRIDFQLGWNVDKKEVVKPENVMPRVRAMLGPSTPFQLEWVSVYTFQCCTMERYRHGRVIFAGDSAHQVSPFGARGCNGGIQDVDNLGWKLALALAGQAPESLLDSYDVERKYAAEENILNSSRSTDFLTPKSSVSRLFRDSVLDLAEAAEFARPMVNSGRLSVPASYDGSPLNGPDDPLLPEATRPGAPILDAPVADGWLTDRIGGRFQLFAVNAEAGAVRSGAQVAEPVSVRAGEADALRRRYLGDCDQAFYLIRPDQHVAARWRAFDPGAVAAAMTKAMGG